ncbi:hypothetical protein CL658_04455 [bacterium]|nr:hypothetical protein [bacterium]
MLMSDNKRRKNSSKFEKGSRAHSYTQSKHKGRSQSSHGSYSRSRKKKFTNKISDHFSKHDFSCKETGKLRVSLGLVGVLEALRGITQKRITIVKGYECPDVAEAKGQLKRNFHTQGLAADIKILTMSSVDVFKEAEKLASITGLGLNIKDDYVHIDTRKADRVLWVEQDNEEIPLTDENRKLYLGE